MSKKTKKRKPRYRDANYSRLGEHARVEKQLIPPLNRLPTNSFSSWRDDHAPEMLWALLLAVTFSREEYLACFRYVVEWMRGTFPPKDDNQSVAQPHDEAKFLACELDHTSLAELSDEHFEQFVRILLKHPLGYGALRPLLLIDCLPGLDRWRKALGVEPTDHDWQTLASAVVHTLDHQSEKSTDVRWLKYVVKIALGKMLFAETMRETVEEIVFFPNKGDMRKVRPSIRAGEMTLRRNPPSPWVAQYWDLLLAKTQCVDSSSEDDYFKTAVPTLARDAILSARHQLAQRFKAATQSTRTDPRLDASFGFAFYALSLLEEVAMPPMSQMILGRIGLRSIAEVAITFAYLLKNDDGAEWLAYRNFGTGQAKLAFLKLEQATGELPSFVEQETLFSIANEDAWQEFVNVNIGHWATKNLRELAIDGGTKDIYDRFYDWTSSYAHAHWGSVRDSNFMTCHNPLHRLHRIPRPYHQLLPTVVNDAVQLINYVLELLEKAHPSMERLGHIQSGKPEEQEEGPSSASAAGGGPQEAG
jgi:hypothetical protein